jgi:D-alanine transaminase
VQVLYLNGAFMPLAEGRVSVEDRGFQFGDGVYEVIRVYGGTPFRMARHLARLKDSLDGVRIPLPEPLPRIEEVCRRLTAEVKDAQVYLQVTRGAAPRAHAFPADVKPTFVAYARPAARYPDDKSFKLVSVPDERWGRCNLKVIALLPNILARQRAVDAGADEGLFFREDGNVTEGTSSNAFLVKGGRVRTHPAGPRILNGVTREAVLEAARDRGLEVEQRPFTLPEAREADEIFMTGTLTEVMPAVSLDGKAVGGGAAGPVTLRIREAFREIVRRECP